MRKHIVNRDSENPSAVSRSWLDLPSLVRVEMTSEEAAYPVESALVSGEGRGWRASEAGGQTIRLVFDEPQRLSRVHLAFSEDIRARTQEFVVRWSPDRGQSYRELVRQQYTFSPPTTTKQVEDYRADLDGVTVIELDIVPDISGGDARATLDELRLS